MFNFCHGEEFPAVTQVGSELKQILLCPLSFTGRPCENSSSSLPCYWGLENRGEVPPSNLLPRLNKCFFTVSGPWWPLAGLSPVLQCPLALEGVMQN